MVHGANNYLALMSIMLGYSPPRTPFLHDEVKSVFDFLFARIFTVDGRNLDNTVWLGQHLGSTWEAVTG